jgi:DNA-binding GntR family transcriptional regulator
VVADNPPLLPPPTRQLHGEKVGGGTAVEIPRPARATAAEAALLDIAVGNLLMNIERTCYASDGRPIETATLTVPDRWEIAYEFPVHAEAGWS